MPDRWLAATVRSGPPVAAGCLLAAAAPAPAACLHTLRTAEMAPDPSAPLLALVALAAWALLGWLLVLAAVSLASRAPGLLGRAAGVVARRIAPAAVRRLVETALGLTVAVGVLAPMPNALASSALASSALPPGPPAAAGSLDWPSPPAPLDWNPTAPPAPAAHPAPPGRSTTAPAAHAAAVVVRPGDSLWSVAADHLPPSASAARIAQAWPAWWAANRDAVGADPDLISPGLQLTPPVQP